MSVNSKILTLKSEIKKGMSVLFKICRFYDEYISTSFEPKQQKLEQAIVISDLVCSYYTCLETIFLRISQFFENDLAKEKWHQDLLQKMCLQIEGVRNAVIQNETFMNLVELLKFRHFKRYYFELEYDWDKLDFI
ncbi:MAG: hypothetical protein MUC94_18140 [bacterium]|nr:hypothetical protein [bacterium]